MKVQGPDLGPRSGSRSRSSLLDSIYSVLLLLKHFTSTPLSTVNCVTTQASLKDDFEFKAIRLDYFHLANLTLDFYQSSAFVI